MKVIYLVLLGIIILILNACIMHAKKVKTISSLWLRCLIGSAIMGAIAYGLYLMLPIKSWVIVADGMYFLSADLMCYFMLKFSFTYTDYSKKHFPGERLIRGLITADAAALFYNNISGWMFDVESKDGRYGIREVYTKHYSDIQYLHLALCYLIMLYVIVRFIYKIRKSSQVYKLKYIAIIAPLGIVIATNVICVFLKLPLDVSVLLYAFLAIIICYATFYRTPNKLIDTAQTYIAENTRQGMVCFDEADNCIFQNKVLRECKEDDVNLYDVIDYFRTIHFEYEEKGIDSNQWDYMLKIGDKELCYRIYYQKLCDKKNKKMGYFFTVDDETENIRKYEQERYRATHDSLTGLLNRESFFDHVDRAISENPDIPRYMIVSDIKDFKLVNNLYGSEYGDAILKLQADLIRKYKTEGNICGRIAGDKFGMLLEKDKFDKETFTKAVHEINEYTNKKKLLVHYHIGIYDVTGLKESAQVLYNRVTLAIATVRDDYDRIFVEYNQDIMNRVLRKNAIIGDFDRAITNHEFKMYLQPQISRDEKIAGAEALVRWQHPEHGLIFPDTFIGVFEEANLIHRLDLEIWNQAAAKLAEWKKLGQENIHISINVSVRDFYYLDVYEELVNIVEKYDINPINLKIEITETAVMTDKQNNFSILSKLKEYGFDIELDDFGSGYSSLNMLKDFHVDVLKIDRMFLKETANMEKSRIILESVICLAKQLGMRIVTEGVESEAQVISLKGMGCDYFQGYYYDKPITVDSFEEKYMSK